MPGLNPFERGTFTNPGILSNWSPARSHYIGADMRNIINRIAAILGAPTVVHPDGKVFVRVLDHWMPL